MPGFRRLVEEILILLWGGMLLLPLIEIIGLDHPRLIYYLMIAACGLDILVPWRLLSWLGKLPAALFVLHHFFYAALPFWPPAWLTPFWAQIRQDLFWTRGGFWTLISVEGKTLVFLLGLLLAHHLLRSAAHHWGKALTYLLVGLMLLAVAGTYAGLDVVHYARGYLFLGLLLMALSSWRRQERRSSWMLNSSQWIPGSLLLAMAVTGFAQAAPRPHLTWHVDWLEQLVTGNETGGPQKVRYGSNDASLGGPFLQEQTVLFTVEAPLGAYWRGESKERYTGKGWDEDQARNRPLAVGKEITGARRNGEEGTLVEQLFTVKANSLGILLAANRPLKVLELPGRKELSYLSGSQRLSAGWLDQNDAYRVLSFVPQFQADDLRQSGTGYATAVTRRYLQLPASLPSRVRDLARQVTAGQDNPYDKALALESHLRSNYRYETRDVPPPPAEEDFVDHFLFSIGRGYCDHFSTAMVVMARAVGLPARWVKGFMPGEEVNGPGDSGKIFVVRSLNAHSWTEIYFEGYGWVPFEPTPGFSREAAGAAIEEIETAELPAIQPEMELPEETGLSIPGLVSWSDRLLLFAVLLMTAVVLAVVVFIRSRMRTSVTLDQGQRLAIRRAYFSAVRAMGHPKRQPAETFGAFAQRRAESNSPASEEFLVLTRLWETACYGSRPPEQHQATEAVRLSSIIRNWRRRKR